MRFNIRRCFGRVFRNDRFFLWFICEWFESLEKVSNTATRFEGEHLLFVLLYWMPNKCWLISFVADTRLLGGINDGRRSLFSPVAEVEATGVVVVVATSRLSCDSFFVTALPLLKLLCWKRVFRCFGNDGSFKLALLPHSSREAISNDWNVW